MLAAPYATNAQYDQAAAELQLAMDGLAKAVDRSGLEDALEQAGALASDGWTVDSWNALQAKIAAGKALLEDGAATQEQIDHAEKGIRDAMAALEKANADGGGSAGSDDQASGGDQGQGGAGKTDDGAQKSVVAPAGSGSATAGKAGASAGLATTGDAAGVVAGTAGVAAIVAAATALGARLRRRALKGRR